MVQRAVQPGTLEPSPDAALPPSSDFGATSGDGDAAARRPYLEWQTTLGGYGFKLRRGR